MDISDLTGNRNKKVKGFEEPWKTNRELDACQERLTGAAVHGGDGEADELKQE